MSRENDEFKIESLTIQEFKGQYENQAPTFFIPEEFKHVDLQKLHKADGDIDKWMAVIKSVHPWSALHHGLSALDVVLWTSTKTIPAYFGRKTEIQVLTPQ